MGVFDALTTAVTGLQAQSFALQNISGNIANSQTTAFKRTETSFADLVQDQVPKLQVSGSVTAASRATNSVQGSIQSASVGTFMAISGDGYFIVQKPSDFSGGAPVFNNADLYSRRGDFQIDKDGFLVNASGYYLMGIPIDATREIRSAAVPRCCNSTTISFLPKRRPRFRTPPISPRTRSRRRTRPAWWAPSCSIPRTTSPIRWRVPRRTPRSPAPARRCRRTRPPW